MTLSKTYLPLPKGLTIRPSSIHGMGLFWMGPGKLDPETQLGIAHVLHEDFENGYIRTPLGGFYNHSKTPNCELRDGATPNGTLTKELWTIKEITVQQELTCTYSLYQLRYSLL